MILRNTYGKTKCNSKKVVYLSYVPSIFNKFVNSRQKSEVVICWYTRCIAHIIKPTNVFCSIYNICHNIDIPCSVKKTSSSYYFFFFHHVKSFYSSVKYTIVSTRFAKPTIRNKNESKIFWLRRKTVPKTTSTVELKNVYFESNTNGFDSRSIHLHKVHALGLCCFIFCTQFRIQLFKCMPIPKHKRSTYGVAWFMCICVEYRLLFTKNFYMVSSTLRDQWPDAHCN